MEEEIVMIVDAGFQTLVPTHMTQLVKIRESRLCDSRCKPENPPKTLSIHGPFQMRRESRILRTGQDEWGRWDRT